MEEKFCGVVLNAVPYGENDKILNVYSLEKGLVSAGIKGVKKAGAKLKFASEPFCFAEFTTNVSVKRRTVTGASLIDSFYPIREDVKRFYAGSVVLDYLKRFCKYESSPGELFSITVQVLKELAYSDSSPYFSLANFLIKALKISGYGLNFNGCESCGGKITGKVFFNPSDGGFYCQDCYFGQGREIKESTYLTLLSIKDQSFVDSDALSVLKLIDYYIETKLETSLSPLKVLIKL